MAELNWSFLRCSTSPPFFFQYKTGRVEKVDALLLASAPHPEILFSFFPDERGLGQVSFFPSSDEWHYYFYFTRAADETSLIFFPSLEENEEASMPKIGGLCLFRSHADSFTYLSMHF